MKNLQCACCGSYAGRWKQWYNQDRGFGLCGNCTIWIASRTGRQETTSAEMDRVYGKAGVHRPDVSDDLAERGKKSSNNQHA